MDSSDFTTVVIMFDTLLAYHCAVVNAKLIAKLSVMFRTFSVLNRLFCVGLRHFLTSDYFVVSQRRNFLMGVNTRCTNETIALWTETVAFNFLT